MKFSLNPRVKSVVVTLSNIEEFTDILLKIAKEENKKSSYKKEPKFEIEYNDGRAYEFTTKEEFIKQLRSGLLNIKELNLSFWGEHVNIRLSYSYGGFGGWINLNIESDHKGTLLDHEDDIMKLFKRNSWNWVINEPFFLIPISFIAWFICLVPLSKLEFLSKNLSILLAYITALIIMPIFFFKLPKLYPLLVVVTETDSSGRIFKKDLWKIIIVIITLIIIPILINKFF